MIFTDFPNGLSDSSDYLGSNNSVNAQLTGSTADISRLVVSAELDSNLKEIICSLLAGRGLKLPNTQICVSLNLKELLNNFSGTMQQPLLDALNALDSALDTFLDHLKLNEVLDRITNVLAEVTNIANMINFCSSPLDPIQIPSVLENAMESFLGGGVSIIGRIGSLISGGISGCLIDGSVNCAAFDGGILGDICNNFTDVTTGVADSAFIDAIVAESNAIITEIDDIIARETGVVGTYDNGGSDLTEVPRPVNEGLGALFNADDEGIQGVTRNAAQIWSAYQQLGSYQVVDSAGNVYNNIFELFVDEDLLRILRRTPNPTPEIATQEPVYNYCGEIIGYTKVISQKDLVQSVGTVPAAISQPGFNAGGLPTNPVNAAAAISGAAGVTSGISNGTNVGNANKVFKQNNAGILEFRTLTSGTGISLTETADNIEISSSIVAGDNKGTANTTNNASTEVLFGGARLTPASNTCWFFTVTAVANRSDAAAATAIKIEGLVDNNAGTVGIVGATGNKTTYNSTASTSNYDLTLDILANEFRVRVNGDTGHTVDWKVNLEYIASP